MGEIAVGNFKSLEPSAPRHRKNKIFTFSEYCTRTRIVLYSIIQYITILEPDSLALPDWRSLEIKKKKRERVKIESQGASSDNPRLRKGDIDARYWGIPEVEF